MSTRLKVGFVGFLSCLVLMLSLFTFTGVASAHSTQALQSQTSTSTLAKDQVQDRVCRTFFIVLRRWNSFDDQFLFVRGEMGRGEMGRHERILRRHEEIRVVIICGRHRSEHNEFH
jgi:hypothetical protein